MFQQRHLVLQARVLIVEFVVRVFASHSLASWQAVLDLIKAHCVAKELDYATQGQPFFKQLEATAEKEKKVESMAVRLWTSTDSLGGREFCSIVNEAVSFAMGLHTHALLSHA